MQKVLISKAAIRHCLLSKFVTLIKWLHWFTKCRFLSGKVDQWKFLVESRNCITIIELVSCVKYSKNHISGFDFLFKNLFLFCVFHILFANARNQLWKGWHPRYCFGLVLAWSICCHTDLLFSPTSCCWSITWVANCIAFSSSRIPVSI